MQVLSSTPEEKYRLKRIVIEEKKEKFVHRQLLPHATLYWVPDSSVSYCCRCKATFTFFTRRHHCRVCSLIYCYACCNQWRIIPLHISIVTRAQEVLNREEKQRICITCDTELSRMEEQKGTLVHNLDEWNVLEYLTFSDWARAGCVCKDWYTYLSRKLHYTLTLPDRSYVEKSEAVYAWTHRYDFIGTALQERWLIFLLCTVDEDAFRADYITRKAPCSHKQLIKYFEEACCTLIHTICRRLPAKIDIWRIAPYMFSVYTRDIVIEHLLNYCRTTPNSILAILPLLIDIFPRNQAFTQKLFNTIASKYPGVLTSLYWWGITQRSILLPKMPEKNMKTILRNSECILYIFDLIEKHAYVDRDRFLNLLDQYLYQHTRIVVPTDTKRTTREWVRKDTKFFASATKPIALRWIDENKRPITLIFKLDDVRKDAIMHNIFYVIDAIIHNELALDNCMVMYPVLPCAEKRGIIQVVEDAATLAEIRYKYKETLLLYVMNRNPLMTVSEIRRNFMRSCAVYMIVSYLFAIGDRHSGNAMLTRDGRIFPIDLTFLLGEEASWFSPVIQLTPDMVEILGGESSEDFKCFKLLCKTIYNCLRKHFHIFYTFLSFLVKKGLLRLNDSDLVRRLQERFRPGMQDYEAEFQFNICMEEVSSSGKLLPLIGNVSQAYRV